MDHSHSIDIEAPAVSLEDKAPSNGEIASGEIEEAISLEEGDSSAEEITQENSLVHSLREKLNAFINDTIDGPIIFRVPANLRKNRDLLEPSVVSIGPYHHGSRHLAPMENKKLLLLKDILSWPNTKVTLEACVEKIKGLQLRVRNCYSETVDMDDDSFVQMLILDGTFIVQFLSKPIDLFKREIGWAAMCIRTDLILLENQIPFFVFQSLWDLYNPCVPLINLENLEIIGEMLCSSLKSGNFTIPLNGFHHLLHLCHHLVVPDMSTHVTVLPGCSCFSLCKCVNSNNEISNIIPCATELQNAGIKFRKKKPPCKMMDVTFRGGTLEIPSIVMYDTTKPLFINLLAFEQSQVYSIPRQLSSYATFIDNIINTENDVAILQRHGIIENWLSGEEEVALFINQLCVGATIIEGHYLTNLFKEVNLYYNSECHRYRAKLMRDYFNSPWSIISFIGALIILGLTFAQTYFAGDAYFHPSPN